MSFWSSGKLGKTKQWKALYPDDFIFGDVVIGEFLVDDQFMVIRCDRKKSDWGHVMIGLPLDTRDDWPDVALSISNFMEKILLSPGIAFWEIQK